MSYEYELYNLTEQDNLEERPVDGAYIKGLFLEGAGWNFEEKVLVDSNVKQLYVQMPVIWMKPVKSVDIVWGHRYNCPVYKTSERRGMLSTTGHSTNFVMMIRIPSDRAGDEWIKAGVAMLTQLDD